MLLSEQVFRFSRRNPRTSRIEYVGRDMDWWFGIAKKSGSFDHFIVASVLSAKEAWEIIGK